MAQQRVANVIRNEIQSRVDQSALNVADVTESKLALVVDACNAIAKNDVIVNGVIDLEYRREFQNRFCDLYVCPAQLNSPSR